MLKKPPGPSSKSARPCSLVMFFVGGRKAAARVEEVGGVWPWTDETMPVPSGTPFVNAVLRHGEEILPVYDLAAKLDVQVREPGSLCLIAKRADGPMAVRIDGDIPTLHAIDEGDIRRSPDPDPDLMGTCRVGADEVWIYSLATLGRVPIPRAEIPASCPAGGQDQRDPHAKDPGR